jgi:hypothetical protein
MLTFEVCTIKRTVTFYAPDTRPWCNGEPVAVGWFYFADYDWRTLERQQTFAVSRFMLIGDDAISQIRAAVAIARDYLTDQGLLHT